jgi:hypothetical protein
VSRTSEFVRRIQQFFGLDSGRGSRERDERVAREPVERDR